MGPKGKHPSTGDLFQQPLAELIRSGPGELDRISVFVSGISTGF